MTNDELKQQVLTALEDMKALDIKVLDVKGLTNMTDMLVIATGTSNRHVRSVASYVVSEMKKQGVEIIGVEGENEGEWVLVDLANIVVHVMQKPVREFYALEKLWSVGAER